MTLQISDKWSNHANRRCSSEPSEFSVLRAEAEVLSECLWVDCGSRVTLQHFGVPKMYAYSSRRSPWSLGHRVFVGKKKLRFVRFRHEPSETWCLFSGQGKAVGTLHSLKKKNLSLSLVCSSGGTFKEPLYVMSAQFFFSRRIFLSNHSSSSQNSLFG